MTLFTVEQLELIRRLRLTGISADSVVEAFRALEQVEAELDAARAHTAALTALMVPPMKFLESPIAAPPPPPQPQPSTTVVDNPVLLQALQAQPPVAVTICASTSSPSSAPQPMELGEPRTSTSDKPSSGGTARPIRSLRTPMREITTLDDPKELDEFMEQGEEACIHDMKTFITQFSLRQTTVAMMTGVSQPYISKLLNGNHRELSLRCRKNIYSWYLNCRRHPEKLASFLADPSTRLETNGDGELVPQRRERYVFRPVLLRMLEAFFSQTPFPDLTRRMEIAAACNAALQADKKGAELVPKEIVTPQVVANWFANKRKELRRKNNENDAAASLASATAALSNTTTLEMESAACSPSPSADEPEEGERLATRSSSEESATSPSLPLGLIGIAHAEVASLSPATRISLDPALLAQLSLPFHSALLKLEQTAE